MDTARHVNDQFSRFLSTGTLVAVLIGGLAPSARARINGHVLAGCAAFASNGGSVTATTDATNLSAEITDPAGNVSRLGLPVTDPATDNPSPSARRYSCKGYFDRDSDVIAIGVSYGFPGRYSLRIGVADAKSAKWDLYT